MTTTILQGTIRVFYLREKYMNWTKLIKGSFKEIKRFPSFLKRCNFLNAIGKFKLYWVEHLVNLHRWLLLPTAQMKPNTNPSLCAPKDTQTQLFDQK